MRYDSIYVGTWTPRTLVHLREFHDALTTQESELFKKTDLKKWIKPIGIKQVDYVSGPTDSVVVSGKQETRIYQGEDGIIFAERRVKDPKKDADELGRFFKDAVLKFWKQLYSKGAPIPRTFSRITEFYPYVITVKQANKKAVAGLFKRFEDDIVEEADWKAAKYWRGRRLIVLQIRQPERQHQVIRNLLFMHSYKFQAHKMLHLHRFIWEDIESIRERTQIRSKDLPVMRDSLLDLQRQIAFFLSRIKQMKSSLHLLKETYQEEMVGSDYSAYIHTEVVSLLSVQDYLEELWEMTQNYARSTVDLMQMLYSDNERRELNTLQMIFTIGVIAEVLVLGEVTGGRLQLFSPAGEVLAEGRLFTYSYVDLALFGVAALGAALILYSVLHWGFNRLKHNRVLETTSDVTRFKESVTKRLK